MPQTQKHRNWCGVWVRVRLVQSFVLGSEQFEFKYAQIECYD